MENRAASNASLHTFMTELPTPHFDLGSVLQQEGRFGETLSEYRVGLASDEAARIHNNIGNIGTIWLNDGDLPKALAEYSAALRMSPEEPHSLLRGGTIEYRQGQTDAALEDLGKSAQFSPLAITYLVMGRVYEDKRNLEAAAKSYETTLTMNPKLAEASSTLAALAGKSPQDSRAWAEQCRRQRQGPWLQLYRSE